MCDPGLDHEKAYPWRHLSNEELENAYSPSHWSKRCPKDEIIDEHMKIASKRSQEAREVMQGHWREVTYGKGHREKLDVYGENLPAESAMVIYVHGGYWQALHKDISAYLVPPLYRAGVLVAVVGYELAPEVSVGDIVGQVRSAMSWACDLARGRGSVGVVLAGWSAGGHLITQVLSTEVKDPTEVSSHRDLIKGVVLLAGILDLRPLVHTYVNDPLKLTPESAWELSPMRLVGEFGRAWTGSSGGLRVLATVGEFDSPEFVKQGKAYCKACRGASLEAEFVVLKNLDHFNLVEDLFLQDSPVTTLVLDFVLATCRRMEKNTVDAEGDGVENG